MKLKFDPTNKEQVEMIRDMGSTNREKSAQAQEAFAAALDKVIREVIMQASTTSGLYEDVPFVQDQSASIPLDTYYYEAAGHFTIWSQNTAGGLPSNYTHDVAELKVQTYVLESAISMAKKYAAQSRLDVVGKAVSRLLNEVMIKQDTNAWLVILKALALSSTRGTQHLFRTSTADVLDLATFNALLTRGKRINSSYANGTPDSTVSRGVTDLFISPEMTEQIRAMAYQPMNTRPGSITTSGATALGAPESFRQSVFANGGTSEIYGIQLHELNEFGIGYIYNTIFSRFAGSTTYSSSTGGSSAAFAPATEEILVGIDKSRGGLYRPVATNSDTGSTFTLMPDDQYPARSEKFGWYGKVEEGRVIADSRALLGLIV